MATLCFVLIILYRFRTYLHKYMNMKIYLEKSSKSELAILKGGLNKRYLPVGAPLLDFLAVDTEGPTGWKYPNQKNLKTYQDNKGLTFSVIKKVEVREIVCGESTVEDIEKFHEWMMKKHLENQDEFDTGVISMDVEDVKASYFDIMRMAGEIVILNLGTQGLQEESRRESCSRY